MQAAATTCYAAAHTRLAGVSGRYFADCNEALPSPAAASRREAARLWQASEAMISGSAHHGGTGGIPVLQPDRNI
jgi:retinol dehydrogenase-12